MSNKIEVSLVPVAWEIESSDEPWRNKVVRRADVADEYACKWRSEGAQAEVFELYRDQPAHYTAVDMTTAAAQGFRDGQAAAEGGAHFTCIGKGGDYRDMGVAIGAGTSKGDLVQVYRDTKNGQLYFREPEDFIVRMDLIKPAAEVATDE